jgi:hypothetical protein
MTATFAVTAAPSKTQEWGPEQQDEEKFIAEQERLAQEEKAQRAREELEMARQLQIQEARAAAGLCIMCGQQRSQLDRLAGRAAHRRCKVFLD